MAKKALCIGINNYPATHMDLQGCVNDANDWAAALSGRGFAVTTLLDDQATKLAMVAAMGHLIGKAAWPILNGAPISTVATVSTNVIATTPPGSRRWPSWCG
jgi:Caspase domain